MLISVVIPTFKPQQYYFEECLVSLFNQTLSHELYELIIVLNGEIGTQYTEMISNCMNNAPIDLNWHLIKTQYAGVSNARNVGINIAQGQYICFVDDDDIVSCEYLEALSQVSTPQIIGVSNVLTFTLSTMDSNSDFFACKVIQQKNHSHSLFKNRAILAFPVAKLIHRDIIGNRRFNLRFKNGEDALFMTEISDKIEDFQFTSQNAVYYVRKRAGSASRVFLKRKTLLVDTLVLIKEYVRIFLSSPFSYNFLLFISRVPGVIKGAITLYGNKR